MAKTEKEKAEATPETPADALRDVVERTFGEAASALGRLRDVVDDGPRPDAVEELRDEVEALRARVAELERASAGRAGGKGSGKKGSGKKSKKSKKSKS